MITLELHKPHWIKDEGDDPEDQCAHGLIEFRVDDEEFVAEKDGEWTVSAAALFFLRAVSEDHSPRNSLAEGNFLIPCCGFNIYPSEQTKFPFYILGCNTGIDPTVSHEDGRVRISLGDKEAIVPLREWAQAVLSFAKQVEDFYANSAEKVQVEDEFEKQGWDLFWADWSEQKKRVEQVLVDSQ